MQDRFKFRRWDKQLKVMNRGQKYPFLISSDGENSKNSILMQCTGLKDKNGKPIYEGDILQCELEIKSKNVVEWDSYFLTYKLGANHLAALSIERWMIIGNIYENPELLNNKGKN